MSAAIPTRLSYSNGPGQSQPRIATVCVVDPITADYATWQQTAREFGIELVMLPSAEAALRKARSTAVDLWVVSTDLPGLSGAELCGLLRGQSPCVPVYLVCDEYSPATERTAWAARATMFACKPAHQAWLADWAALRGTKRRSAQLSPASTIAD